MFTNQLKHRCIEAIKHHITLPKKSWCVINDTSIRFSYSVDKQMKYLVLATPEEAAAYLVQHGNIYSYTVAPGGVRIYRQTFEQTETKDFAPVQKIVMEEIEWKDLHEYISHSDVLKFAAEKEYEEKGAIAGLTGGGKIIKFCGNYFKAA